MPNRSYMVAAALVFTAIFVMIAIYTDITPSFDSADLANPLAAAQIQAAETEAAATRDLAEAQRDLAAARLASRTDTCSSYADAQVVTIPQPPDADGNAQDPIKVTIAGECQNWLSSSSPAAYAAAINQLGRHTGDVPLGGMTNQLLTGDGSDGAAWTPSAMTAGDILTWNGTAFEWGIPSSEVPLGGSTSQLLAGDDSNGAAWTTATAPTDGQALHWNATTTAFEWRSPASSPLPAGGRDNQMLASDGAGGWVLAPQAAPSDGDIIAWDETATDFAWTDPTSLQAPSELPARDDTGYRLIDGSISSVARPQASPPTASNIIGFTYQGIFSVGTRLENSFVAVRLPITAKPHIGEYSVVIGESDGSRITRRYASGVWTHILDTETHIYYIVFFTDKPAGDSIFVQRSTPSENHQLLAGGRAAPNWTPAEPPNAGQTIVWGADNAFHWADPADNLLVASKTLSAADIQGLSTAREQIIEPPPLGQYIIVHRMVVTKAGGGSSIPSSTDITMMLAAAPAMGGLHPNPTSASDTPLQMIAGTYLCAGSGCPTNGALQRGWLRGGNYAEAVSLLSFNAMFGGSASGFRSGRNTYALANSMMWSGAPLVVVGFALPGSALRTPTAETAAQRWATQTAGIGNNLSLKIHIYYEIWDPGSP